MDRSSGYEAISNEFLAYRGNRDTRSNAIGVKEVRTWAQSLPRGASVIDLGCGSGFPLTVVLVEEGLQVFGVDASPTLIAAFQRNLPGTPVICESVLESSLFSRAFDAALSIGLVFLLKPDDQQLLLQRCSEILQPHGRLLFTSPARAGTWCDVMTGLESVSLGAGQYRAWLANSGFSVVNEYEDVGENHYFEAIKIH